MKYAMCSAVKLSLLITRIIIIVMATDSKPTVYRSISDTSLLKNESLEVNNTLYKNKTEVNNQISNKKEETNRKDMEQDFNETLGYFAPVFRYPARVRYLTRVWVPIGNITSMECTSEGDPSPNITWYKNRGSMVLENSSHLQNFDNYWTVDIGNFTENDVGNYTCVVCNQVGCIKRTAELNILEPQKYFAPRPKTGNLLKLEVHYDWLTFYCEAEGNPAPVITWHKNNNTKMITWREPSLNSPTFSKTDVILTDFRMSDQGNYTCVACNELGCIEETISLRIDENNFVDFDSGVKKGYPKNITVDKQQTATFLCPLDAYYDDFSTKWYKLSKEDKWILFEEIENKLITTPELTIYNVTKDDEGWYQCFIKSGFWQTKSRAFLKVKELQSPTMKSSWIIPTVATVVIVFGAILFVVVAVVFMKLQREKKQKQLALQMTAEIFEILWKKKVTVLKPQLSDSTDANRPLLKPIVNIEKLKVTRHKNDADDSMVMSEYELAMDNDWEIPRDTFVLDKVLGEGEFGKVVKAECVGTLKGGQSVVAVKMLKDEHTDADMKALVSEMEIMKLVGKHVNIINLLGCCTQNGPLYVVIEFASHGCLRGFLRKHRPGNEYSSELGLEGKVKLTQKDLISFSYQVAKGMEYLVSRQCIHRDLAARNVLVSDGWVLKIADFGLARDVQDSNYYKKKTAGKLPARWMAPESLRRMIFTVKTDVWSFGVLVWEIMALGATPYPNISGQYLYEHLRSGHRLDKPPSCRFDVYMLMLECWSFLPRGRPSFTDLAESLDKILTLTSKEIHKPPQTD